MLRGFYRYRFGRGGGLGVFVAVGLVERRRLVYSPVRNNVRD